MSDQHSVKSMVKTPPTSEHYVERPACSANFGLNSVAIGIFLIVPFVLKNTTGMGSLGITLFALVAAVLPLVIYDLKQGAMPRLEPRRSDPDVGSRILVKLFALTVIQAVLLGWYWLMRHYFDATFLDTFFAALKIIWPALLIVMPVYVYIVDQRQSEPEDILWKTGRLLLGQKSAAPAKEWKRFAAVWFIKGFFIPYMFVILVRYMDLILQAPPVLDWTLMHIWLLDLCYTVDIAYGVLGYVLTCRLFGTHVRSTDPTILGWIVCLVCYGWFNANFGLSLLTYDDGLQWNDWFVLNPPVFWTAYVLILGLTFIYALSTVAFGYRMSNLTYRGIITSGPYRFTKHPAYLCKVASWWLISVPFLSIDGNDAAVRHTLALTAISVIYFLRAKTEENHLSNYPEYVAYAEWINEHGIFRWIGRILPWARYSQARTRRWGSRI